MARMAERALAGSGFAMAAGLIPGVMRQGAAGAIVSLDPACAWSYNGGHDDTHRDDHWSNYLPGALNIRAAGTRRSGHRAAAFRPDTDPDTDNARDHKHVCRDA